MAWKNQGAAARRIRIRLGVEPRCIAAQARQERAEERATRAAAAKEGARLEYLRRIRAEAEAKGTRPCLRCESQGLSCRVLAYGGKFDVRCTQCRRHGAKHCVKQTMKCPLSSSSAARVEYIAEPAVGSPEEWDEVNEMIGALRGVDAYSRHTPGVLLLRAEERNLVLPGYQALDRQLGAGAEDQLVNETRTQMHPRTWRDVLPDSRNLSGAGLPAARTEYLQQVACQTGTPPHLIPALEKILLDVVDEVQKMLRGERDEHDDEASAPDGAEEEEKRDERDDESPPTDEAEEEEEKREEEMERRERARDLLKKAEEAAAAVDPELGEMVKVLMDDKDGGWGRRRLFKRRSYVQRPMHWGEAAGMRRGE